MTDKKEPMEISECLELVQRMRTVLAVGRKGPEYIDMMKLGEEMLGLQEELAIEQYNKPPTYSDRTAHDYVKKRGWNSDD
jgi:hypothetical protein